MVLDISLFNYIIAEKGQGEEVTQCFKKTTVIKFLKFH